MKRLLMILRFYGTDLVFLLYAVAMGLPILYAPMDSFSWRLALFTLLLIGFLYVGVRLRQFTLFVMTRPIPFIVAMPGEVGVDDEAEPPSPAKH